MSRESKSGCGYDEECSLRVVVKGNCSNELEAFLAFEFRDPVLLGDSICGGMVLDKIIRSR